MYVLVGCLGGIGRSLITWMMGNGCKNFTFLSRSGADRPEAAQVVNEITKAGATANVFRVDVSSEKEVADVVAKVNATMEIRGVVHAAMVLQVAQSCTPFRSMLIVFRTVSLNACPTNNSSQLWRQRLRAQSVYTRHSRTSHWTFLS